MYFFHCLKSHARAKFLELFQISVGQKCSRPASYFSYTSESVPVNVSSPGRETRQERISVHLFCSNLGITEE